MSAKKQMYLDPSALKLYQKWIWPCVALNLKTFGKLTPVAFFRIPCRVFELDMSLNFNINSQSFFAEIQVFPDLTLVTLQLHNDSPQSKNTSAGLVQFLTTQWKANFVCLVMEAWAVKHPAEAVTDIEKLTLVPPSLDPERQEVVATILLTPEGSWDATAPIARIDGVPCLPDKPMIPQYTKFSGRFVIKF